MGIDLQICFPQEAIRLTSVSLVSGVNPAVLSIFGDDFTSVDEVIVNDFPSPKFYVMSPTRLLATVPDQVPPLSVDSVSVISRRLMITPKSIIKFKIGSVPGKVTGILRLVQLFLKVLFTTPGSDIFNKKLGGNGLKPLGRAFGKEQTGSISGRRCTLAAPLQ